MSDTQAGTSPMPTPSPTPTDAESFNPWSIVNLVFSHLASQGLHPVLGESGDPGAPAAALLRLEPVLL